MLKQTYNNQENLRLNIIELTKDFVYKKLNQETTGHDWYHIERVHKIAVYIAQNEKCNVLVVELAALLHDIADWKFNDDEKLGSKITKDFLTSINVDLPTIEHVCQIIDTISFKGGVNKTKMQTIEGMIVQDADRLDALGAIGIARCFAYGSAKGRQIYNPEIKIKNYQSLEEYKNATSTSLNHFYEKLLLLKDLMNTQAGKKLAEQRHQIIEEFLNNFFKEWNCDFNF